jgi:hypothetical protein
MIRIFTIMSGLTMTINILKRMVGERENDYCATIYGGVVMVVFLGPDWLLIHFVSRWDPLS